jgi:rhodanese-related sulfurtransferase
VLAAIRAALTPEEQTLLVLRLEREFSWREVAEVLAEDGRPPPEAELRERFERIKEKLGRMAERKGGAPEPFGQLAVAQAARLVGDSGARFFDLRSPEAYARGHLPGATWTALGDAVRILPADRALHIVYYGENNRELSCRTAARAAAQAGYRNVFIMPAGLDGWREAGKRIETEGHGAE